MNSVALVIMLLVMGAIAGVGVFIGYRYTLPGHGDAPPEEPKSGRDGTGRWVDRNR